MTRKNYSSKLLLGLFVLIVFLGVAVYSAGRVIIQGQTVYGSTDLVGWNMLIAAYTFMALTASGLCLTANFFEVLEIHRFQLLQKRAHFLAISLLVPALGMLSMELGRFDRVIYFILSPNFSSPMWWMGSIYAVYLGLLFFEFWAIHNNYKKIMRATSIITLIFAVAATSILGSIFGVILDKTLWFGSGTPVFFVFSAVVSGLAAMIAGTILTYRLSNQSMSQELQQAIKELSVILTVFLGIALVFTVWRLITVSYARVPDASFVTGSPYGFQFWVLYLVVGLIIPFIILLKAYDKEKTIKKANHLSIAGLMVLIGMYVDKHIFVISGQFNQPFNIPLGTYTSTLTEWGIFLGAIAASIMIYLFGEEKLRLENRVKMKNTKSADTPQRDRYNDVGIV
ncbi:MAG: polysulfide reductase NrfD [Clostridia bacterium]|nr:polysulfide reductase NrfD [Clostridia bacterium]